MNKTTSYLKKILLIFGLTYSLVSFATPIKWELKFWTTQQYANTYISGYYDYFTGSLSNQKPTPSYPGRKSGEGHFTYDPETIACIPRSDGGCAPDSTSSSGYADGFDVNTKIDLIFFEVYPIKVDGTTHVDGRKAAGDGTGFPLEKLWWDDSLGLMSIKDGAATSITDIYSDLVVVSEFNGDLTVSDWNISGFQQNSETSWRASWSMKSDFFIDDGYGPTFDEDSNTNGYLVATRMTGKICKPAEYISNKGKILLSGLKIDNKMYAVTMKKKNDGDFAIIDILRTKDNACQQAEYISHKGRINIPSLTINNKKYKVVMKKISEKNFRIEDISRIVE